MSVSGTFDSPHGAQAGTTNVNYFDFIGGPLSDTLTFTLEYVTGNTARVTGQFISNEWGGPLTPLPNALIVDESLDPRFGYQAGVNPTGPNDFSIVATSGGTAVAPILEPATLLLLGTGLLTGMARRRFRSR